MKFNHGFDHYLPSGRNSRTRARLLAWQADGVHVPEQARVLVRLRPYAMPSNRLRRGGRAFDLIGGYKLDPWHFMGSYGRCRVYQSMGDLGPGDNSTEWIIDKII